MSKELILVALVVAGLATAAMVILAVRSLVNLIRAAKQRTVVGMGLLSDSERESGGLLNAKWAQRLIPMAQRFKPTTEEELAGLRLKLSQAGLNARSAVDLYALVQLLSLMLAAALAVPWFLIGEPGLLLIGVASCAAVGLLLPRFWLSLRTSKRREHISEALASTLDLLVTCMEAGLGLEQAIERVAKELDHSEPDMAEELSLTINEMRAGLPVASAFRKLAQRVNLDEMHMLCSVIIQSSALGASIGAMLRQYAASWRSQRMMDLEEKAGKMTAALTLPLTLCLLPSAILAMLGPAVIVVLENVG